MTSTPNPNPRLRTLLAPGQCAVLIQELQEGVVGAVSGLPALAQVVRQTNLISNVVAVAAMARRVEVPVIHCTAENLPQGFGANSNARLFAAARKSGMSIQTGSDSVQALAEVISPDVDIVLPRLHGLSPMTGSSLDSVLRNDGIRTVVIMGVSLNIAIPNLVFDAVNRSYQVVLISDAVAGIPLEYGKAVVEHSLSLVATVVPSSDVIDVWCP